MKLAERKCAASSHLRVARCESCKDNADMTTHLNTNDSRYPACAWEILRRHEHGEAEANITSAVRDFLILTGLAKSHEIIEENPPSEGSRRAVDLTALDTFIEFKRRIGTTGGFNPDPANVAQLDDYLELSQADGKGVRTGILTDGKYWLLRWPGAGEVNTARPYGFTLENADGWLPLYEWLRDNALTSLDNLSPSREAVQDHFGPGSPLYQRDIDGLRELYRRNSGSETVKLKRRLWHDLLRTALGEIAHSDEQMDDLFVRHTYLSAVVGMVVQASFNQDIYRLAETQPSDLLYGVNFRNSTGLQGVVESDFFAWPAEVGGLPLVRALAHRVRRFDWNSEDTPTDIAAILYEAVIPAEERRTLGEYYTPAWLARAMTQELITAPLHQTVLDPACGSGTFIAEAVRHFIEAARDAEIHPTEVFSRLRASVTGIDVHPVAVHLARSAYALAARSAIADAGYTSVSLPIYLGDALQLRFRAGDMFAEHAITIQVEDEQNSELVFPVSLVERADTFDALMSDIAEYIEGGDDPLLALDDHAITNPEERATLQATIFTLLRLRQEGRDHIWAYYTRNMVRPVALARVRVDVIIGNPPWLNYNQTANVLRTELEDLSKNVYGIWVGGNNAGNQDVASLFFARCVDLYLNQGGIIGFVMRHSVLRNSQYTKWRTGKWQSPLKGRGRNRVSAFTQSVEFNHKTPWDLEQLKPNNFFPVPCCVVFARNTGQSGVATPLPKEVELWQGATGADGVRRQRRVVKGTSDDEISHYDSYARRGGDLIPRCLFFVNETKNPAPVQIAQTMTVNPRRGSLDKKPWKDLDLTTISNQTIEKAHFFDVHLGETIAPYVTLEPLKAILPLKHGDHAIPTDENGPGGIRLGGLERRMRERWQTVSRLWEDNKREANQLNLYGQLDYLRKLSSQLQWQQNRDGKPIRIVHSKNATPTGALLQNDDAIVDHALHWVACKDPQEAHYLLAIINSDAIYEAVKPLMSKGQFGARNLQKHLWKLPIREFDAGNALHREIAGAGEAAAGRGGREADGSALLLG